ncbi:uncharacterized protein [Acropora muricata]|uniref:uncharacterized protein isoform X1 n=1 Tax=Acropora muricata TaxID=159855 RepID=UPI0034E385EF
MWREHFQHVSAPKVNQFTKCGTCLIKEHIYKLKGNAHRISWIERKSILLQQQGRERQKYSKHQNKVRNMPKKFMSIITDGIDSLKKNIPHFKVKSKMEKVRWKWCTVFWLVVSKKNGYPKENSTSS